MTISLADSIGIFANSSVAIDTMRAYVTPTLFMFAGLASIACTFFIVQGGYAYMTSAGKPEALDHAKRVMRGAVLGLVIIFAATAITSILANAYGNPANGAQSSLPSLNAITPTAPSNGLVEVLINAVIGFLNAIIQAVASPFLGALEYFTTETPLMVSNPSVFNLWLVIVGITNILFAVVLALIGFHVMSAASFGFDEIEFKHLLPRVALIFLLINTSIFIIDGIIELSNVLITAITQVAGSSSVWDTLTKVVNESGGQGLAALLMMLAFVIFSVILLVYYVGRLVTLFIGAVLSPLILLIWLIPAFRDFSETAAKTYLTTIFVLFVHVVILVLAASLFTGMAPSSNNDVPNTLMAIVAGLATIIALLKTQGVMMQFSYVSGGARNARKLGGQFMNGVSYLTGKGKGGVAKAASGVQSAKTKVQYANARRRIQQAQPISYNQPKTDKSGVTVTRTQGAAPTPRAKTGTTTEAPKVTPRDVSAPTKAKIPKNNAEDKIV
jgi:Type IV secretion system pilin